MISDADLLAYIRPSTNDDLPTLRRLEKAAIAYIQTRTGRYWGGEGEVVETLQWRGWPMPLANLPIDDALTSFESWDGSAWSAVDAGSYSLVGGFIYIERGNSAWSPLSMPTRYRVTYDAGYSASGDVWAAPEDIKQAVLLLVGHWFENREGVTIAHIATELPLAVAALIDGHIRVAV